MLLLPLLWLPVLLLLLATSCPLMGSCSMPSPLLGCLVALGCTILARCLGCSTSHTAAITQHSNKQMRRAHHMCITYCNSTSSRATCILMPVSCGK